MGDDTALVPLLQPCHLPGLRCSPSCCSLHRERSHKTPQVDLQRLGHGGLHGQASLPLLAWDLLGAAAAAALRKLHNVHAYMRVRERLPAGSFLQSHWLPGAEVGQAGVRHGIQVTLACRDRRRRTSAGGGSGTGKLHIRLAPGKGARVGLHGPDARQGWWDRPRQPDLRQILAEEAERTCLDETHAGPRHLLLHRTQAQTR